MGSLLGHSNSTLAASTCAGQVEQLPAVSFTRKKTGVPVLVHLGTDALNVFKDLPSEAPLFPYLSRVRAGDRATEFGQRCRQLGIKGLTLHSYRYV